MREKKKNVIWQMLSDFRFNSILIKNFFVILLVLLCIFVGIIWMVSQKMEDVVRSEVMTMSQNALNQTKERMDTLMNEVVQISGQLSLDDEIMMFLLPDSDGRLNQEATYYAKERIKKYADIFDYIDSVYVYANKTRYVVTSDGGGELENFADRSWYENLTERIYEPSRMISRLKNQTYPMLITYIQPIRLTQMQFLGAVIVNIDAERLYEQIATEAFETFLIVDDRENVIFSTDPDNAMKKWSELVYYPLLDEGNSGAQMITLDTEEMVLSDIHSQEFGWRYVSAVPMDRFGEYQSNFGNFYIMMCLVILFLSLAAAVTISVYSYHPVQYILNLLKNPDLFDAQADMEQSFRQDEIHEITGNIVRNFYSNKQMQKELEDYLNLVNRAQITALQAQISPHFLFNTLENLRWRAMDICRGDNEVSQIIMNLSEMLRISLENTQQIISVEDEIKNARLYIEILQLRYADKIRVDWQVDDALLKCQIVKVSLQPLIENAVYHGIKPMREQGLISICVYQENGRLKIRIKDNGIGMSAQECDALNQDLKEMYVMREGHIGLRNVAQRLKLILGENAAISIVSGTGEGTAVTMDLPLHYMGVTEEK